MRVFLAGASGAIGTRLVPQLIDAGHEVIGTHTSPSSGERVRALGARPVALDLLDARAVRKAVRDADPDAIVHQGTALADARFGRNFDRTFAQTNCLRTEGTDNLLAAAREAGVRRFVAQSYASMRNARYGAANDGLIEPVRKHQLPIVGDGGGFSPGSTLTTPLPRPCSPSNTTARRSTTSSTTSPPRCGSGCRCLPRRSARSRPATSRSGSRA
jgi:GDP-D-mannose dehydratase